MAPSAAEIKVIFDTVYQGAIAQHPFSHEPERLKQFLSPDAKIHIIGQGFPFAIQSDSFDTVMANVARPMHDLLDPDKPSKSEVIRVIGGGNDPWAALDGKTTATTKNGKSLYKLNSLSSLVADYINRQTIHS
jgi:hypothetical protein